VSAAFEAGNVWLPDAEIAPWVVEYVDEMCSFPNGTHDDDVDSTTQALNRLIYYTNHRPPVPPEPQEHEAHVAWRMDKHLNEIVHKKKKGAVKQV
jgi:hypothetical protein